MGLPTQGYTWCKLCERLKRQLKKAIIHPSVCVGWLVSRFNQKQLDGFRRRLGLDLEWIPFTFGADLDKDPVCKISQLVRSRLFGLAADPKYNPKSISIGWVLDRMQKITSSQIEIELKRCIQVAGMYAWVQFDAYPRSWELELRLSSHEMFIISCDTRLLSLILDYRLYWNLD